MELKELLELKEPTIEQYAETERLLRVIVKDANEEIARLDAEDRARGADRLVGKDDGGEERAKAKEIAVRRRDDAEGMLAQAMAGSANLQARLEKEADQRAWAKVREHLGNRVEALKEIEVLSARIGELFEDICRDGEAAMNAAPVKPDRGLLALHNVHGWRPYEIGLAVVACVHNHVRSPFGARQTDPGFFAEVFCRNVRIDGISNFATPFHNELLANEV
ncbi:MAG TPA: hypothetical protein VK165_10065 [Azonexus sp.]|nr:hypothetical protein [Azonexus sp.]